MQVLLLAIEQSLEPPAARSDCRALPEATFEPQQALLVGDLGRHLRAVPCGPTTRLGADKGLQAMPN